MCIARLGEEFIGRDGKFDVWGQEDDGERVQRKGEGSDCAQEFGLMFFFLRRMGYKNERVCESFLASNTSKPNPICPLQRTRSRTRKQEKRTHYMSYSVD